MKCAICGGRVEWQGPLADRTHTKCLACGELNCQEFDPSDYQSDPPPVQSFQSPDTDPHEKDAIRCGERPFERNAERRAVDVIL